MKKGCVFVGLRKYKRQIAKDRLECANFGNVNKKLHVKRDGLPLWRAVLTGKGGRDAERVQMNYGKLLKAKREERKKTA